MKTIKITTVGDGATGKANLLMAFKRPDFQYVYQIYTPCLFESFTRKLLIDGEIIAVSMQHTQGQEDYDRFRPVLYRDTATDVCLIIFSVISPESFENVTEKWLPEVNNYLPKTPCVLIGTKSDLRNSQTILDRLAFTKQKPVALNEIYSLCTTYQIPYRETSAHTGFGVEECFNKAVRTALKFKYDMEIPLSTKIFNIPGPNDKPLLLESGTETPCTYNSDEPTMECFGQEQYDSYVQAISKDKIIDNIEVCITHHSERLIHEVQICKILDYMMSQCAISTEDRNDIEHHPRPSEQNKTLLALIPKRGQVVFDIFIKALYYCQYRDLADLLVLDMEPDTTTAQTGESKESTELKSWTNVWPSKVRLQKNYIDIITLIKHDMITDHLISKEILTLDDVQVIEASPAQKDKNRKLLEILLQGAKNGLDEFLVALRLDVAYTDLAEQIEKTNVGPAEIKRLQNCFQDKHL